MNDVGVENVRTFAHGTSKAYAEDIETNGLNTDAAQAASRGGRINSPGSFFTHEIGPPENPGPGFQFAYEWGRSISIWKARGSRKWNASWERWTPIPCKRFSLLSRFPS